MTAVYFKDFKANNYAPPLTLEEIFKLYGSWSGLHDFSFDNLMSTGTLTVTGAIASQWNQGGYLAPSMPPSFEIRYHKTNYRQGVLITSPGQLLYLYITTNSSGYPEIYQWGALRQSIPKATPEEADVRIVFRQQQNSDDQTQVWQSVSIYMNNALISTYNVLWNEAYSNIKVAFMAYGTDSITYTNVAIPELCDTAEFGTLDPGAVPTDGLQLTIEGRYLKYFVRYNGTFRAWKVKSITSQHTFASGDFYSDDVPADITELATHVRMMGAWLWSEAIDTDLAQQYGHRFQEVNNSMLLTKQECFLEASNTIKRMKEAAFTQTLDAALIPMLETEDRITTPEGDWIVTQYALDLAVGEIEQQSTIRSYQWDEP